MILYFDFIGGHRLLLKAFGFPAWTTKAELPFLLKWLACYFCTSFWIGVIIATVCFFAGQNLENTILFLMSNTIASRLLDYLLGYQSFKSK